MPLEVSIAGIYVPGPLVMGVALLPLYWLLDHALARVGAYRRAAHPSLLRIALFVLLFAGALLLVFR